MSGPVVLLADSQLLFNHARAVVFHQQLRRFLKGQEQGRSAGAYCVYVGAANNNRPEFFAMAEQALSGLGFPRCEFLKAGLTDLKTPQQTPALILLAGGDPLLGWQTLEQPELQAWLVEQWHKGALLLGISAGAMHLTSAVLAEGGKPYRQSFMELYPLVTFVHEEAEDWPSYQAFQALGDSQQRSCLKIPFGSGCWIQGDEIRCFGRQSCQWIKNGKLQPLPLLTN